MFININRKNCRPVNQPYGNEDDPDNPDEGDNNGFSTDHSGITKTDEDSGLLRNEVNSLKNDIFGSGEPEKERSEEENVKAKKEEKKREDAQKQFEDEKRKKREQKEYQREKFREGIRQKYGIEKTAVKKDYNMSEEEFVEFKEKVASDRAEKQRSQVKIEQKLERRKAKKELKSNVKDTCKTQ
eukprot:maker-scaffold441_size170131-snap-gene-0.42 protein:Tk02651 transcript:maker-scaffold441_size170131-snap-gene-0.42-mRNA-1 annotation:"Complexin-1"